MDWDEPKAKSSKIVTLGEDLATSSIKELEERIGKLNDEIARTEAVITAKKKHSAAADQLFGKG
jgi:uncharacterized small protein (DUF1192 family)